MWWQYILICVVIMSYGSRHVRVAFGPAVSPTGFLASSIFIEFRAAFCEDLDSVIAVLQSQAFAFRDSEGQGSVIGPVPLCGSI